MLLAKINLLGLPPRMKIRGFRVLTGSSRFACFGDLCATLNKCCSQLQYSVAKLISNLFSLVLQLCYENDTLDNGLMTMLEYFFHVELTFPEFHFETEAKVDFPSACI